MKPRVLLNHGCLGPCKAERITALFLNPRQDLGYMPVHLVASDGQPSLLLGREQQHMRFD